MSHITSIEKNRSAGELPPPHIQRLRDLIEAKGSIRLAVVLTLQAEGIPVVPPVDQIDYHTDPNSQSVEKPADIVVLGDPQRDAELARRKLVDVYGEMAA